MSHGNRWTLLSDFVKETSRTLVKLTLDAQLTRVYWEPLRAMCGDMVALRGESASAVAPAQVSGVALLAGKKVSDLGPVSPTDPHAFALTWQVKDVAVTTTGAVAGEMSTGAAKRTAEAPLTVDGLSIPDPQPVTWALRAGRFGWTASFRFTMAAGVLHIQQTLRCHKAWSGKRILFDFLLDGRSDWAWAKKIGATWHFWDETMAHPKWRPLWRPIGGYLMKTVIFIRRGSAHVDRSDPSSHWPETFAEPPGFEAQKSQWLANIHQVWDDKFAFKRKDCASADPACCRWIIRITVDWSNTTGDKDVYVIWAQDWERSNARDWYLSEHRLGVAGHECGHLLGAYDEYAGGAVSATGKIDPNSIMGSRLSTAHPRHFDEMIPKIGEKIFTATGRAWTFEVRHK